VESSIVGDDLKSAFGELIDEHGPWDWWTTFTWRDRDDKKGNGYGAVSTWSACKMFRRFMQLDEADSDFVFVVEANPSRMGNHVHAVVGGVSGLRREDVWRSWFLKHGRCRIEPYDMDKGSKYYLGKYISKRIHDWGVKIGDVEPPKVERVGRLRNVKSEARDDKIVQAAYFRAVADGKASSSRKGYREFAEAVDEHR